MSKIYNSWGTPPYSWGGAEPPPRCITHTLVQPPGPPGVPQALSLNTSDRRGGNGRGGSAPSPYHSCLWCTLAAILIITLAAILIITLVAIGS